MALKYCGAVNFESAADVTGLLREKAMVLRIISIMAFLWNKIMKMGD